MNKPRQLAKQAAKLASAIEKQYNLLTIENPAFFDTYHDDMRIQMDCAWEEAEEIEHYEGNNQLDHAKTGLQNLKDTLVYCKAVIQLQIQSNNLPKSIYG